MKSRIQKILLGTSLALNICLIITVVLLYSDVINIEKEVAKVNKTVEVQSEIITNIQQDYETLKIQINN